MDANDEVTRFLAVHLDAVAYSGALAWNLREWVRECRATPSLRPVLDSLLPHYRAELELKLIDSNLSTLATGLPDNDGLSVSTLIAFVEGLRFPHGTRLQIPRGAPPVNGVH